MSKKVHDYHPFLPKGTNAICSPAWYGCTNMKEDDGNQRTLLCIIDLVWKNVGLLWQWKLPMRYILGSKNRESFLLLLCPHASALAWRAHCFILHGKLMPQNLCWGWQWSAVNSCLPRTRLRSPTNSKEALWEALNGNIQCLSSWAGCRWGWRMEGCNSGHYWAPRHQVPHHKDFIKTGASTFS